MSRNAAARHVADRPRTLMPASPKLSTPFRICRPPLHGPGAVAAVKEDARRYDQQPPARRSNMPAKPRTIDKRKAGKRKARKRTPAADAAQRREDVEELFRLTAWAEAELALQRHHVAEQHDFPDMFAARAEWLESRLHKMTRRVDNTLAAWRELEADYARIKDGDRASADAIAALAKYITLVRNESADTAFASHQAIHSAVQARLVHTLREYNEPEARRENYPKAERKVRKELSVRRIEENRDLDPAVAARKIIAKLTTSSERSMR